MSKRHQPPTIAYSKYDIRKMMRDRDFDRHGKLKERPVRHRKVYVVHAPCAITRDFRQPIFFTAKSDALGRSKVIRQLGYEVTFEVWHCEVRKYTFYPDIHPRLSSGGLSKV